jgi:hypothetical protein
VGSEAGTGFEVERAVAALVVSGNLIRDCYYFFSHGLIWIALDCIGCFGWDFRHLFNFFGYAHIYHIYII